MIVRVLILFLVVKPTVKTLGYVDVLNFSLFGPQQVYLERRFASKMCYEAYEKTPFCQAHVT
jgi:hypothetical protein